MKIGKPTKGKKWKPPANAKSAIAEALEELLPGESIAIERVSPEKAQRIRAVIHIRRKRGSLVGAFATTYTRDARVLRVWRMTERGSQQ